MSEPDPAAAPYGTSVFAKIIAGELPGSFVWRDDTCVAFMSINPLKPGHALVVPIAEIDHWLDAPEALQAHLMVVAGKVGQAIQATFNPARVGLVIAGFEVPHIHLHVVPIDALAEMDFSGALPQAQPEDIQAAADKISAHLDEQR